MVGVTRELYLELMREHRDAIQAYVNNPGREVKIEGVPVGHVPGDLGVRTNVWSLHVHQSGDEPWEEGSGPLVPHVIIEGGSGRRLHVPVTKISLDSSTPNP